MKKNKKVSSGSVTFMNKTMCFSFVFQEVLRVWLRKKHHVCHNVGMYFQRRNVVSPHDPGFFCTKMTINSKIKWNQIKVGAIAISYRCCRSPALWKQVQHISTFFSLVYETYVCNLQSVLDGLSRTRRSRWSSNCLVWCFTQQLGWP